ncbi:helix-turn-helix domain-containing protein [Agromyces sp. H3Y2-19a]|jgi:DNA-binding HxlR family transcriptional regulator|uniref:winged helix-turn-helix transcriptional regulator n=1 Tax=Agromyces TaxID=33877 RepID=UPI001E4E018D|nr:MULTISPECIES: helix-turn-helix domain-containing protein [Agromyces]MCD5345367.1 helix-turn-helix transcriptional regulator [Agromyces sp. S2-1-8]MDF0513474.1 helix-turn-helix domain-containing protein [Agromyces chromiiresistens]
MEYSREAEGGSAGRSADELGARRSARLRELGHIDDEACRRFTGAIEFAGRKWNAAILLAGVRGARRFSEYRDTVHGISDRVLTARLRELEADGLIERHVRPTTPVTIHYTPSTRALQLMELLQPLVEWQRADDRATRVTGAESL